MADEEIKDSILNETKQLLGFEADYTPFDVNVIIFINNALAVLNQIGFGPDKAFTITGPEQKWSDFTTDDMIGSAKTYVYVSVKIALDPEDRSYVLESFKEMKKELEVRLNIQGEGYR